MSGTQDTISAEILQQSDTVEEKTAENAAEAENAGGKNKWHGGAPRRGRGGRYRDTEVVRALSRDRKERERRQSGVLFAAFDRVAAQPLGGRHRRAGKSEKKPVSREQSPALTDARL